MSRYYLKNLTCRQGVVALLAGVILGCGPADGLTSPIVPDPPETPPAPPSVERYGSVVVTTRTSGSDLDPDGYVVLTDGWWDYTAPPTFIASNGTVTLKFIAEGGHSLTLMDVAPNCHGWSLNDRAIVIGAEAVTKVVFEVACKHR